MAKQRFIIAATSNRPAVEQAIDRESGRPAPPIAALKIDDGVWLATFDGTTRQLAEMLGIRSGETGSGIVCAFSTYSGRQPGEVWEWLKVNRPDDD